MVAIAISPEPTVLPEPTFSPAALRELGGKIRFVARTRWESQIEPRLRAEDYGLVPAAVAIANGRALAAGNGSIFAAYELMGVDSMDDVVIHVVRTIGRNPSITVRLATETMQAG